MYQWETHTKREGEKKLIELQKKVSDKLLKKKKRFGGKLIIIYKYLKKEKIWAINRFFVLMTKNITKQWSNMKKIAFNYKND